MTIRFAAPLWLAVLAVAVPLAAVAIARLDRRRRAAVLTFGEPGVLAPSSDLRGTGTHRAAQGLALAALALVLLALARPQLGSSSEAARRRSRDVLFVLDVSRSMNARDGAPSRLDAAKRAARAIARALPDDRVGLVLFGASAFLELPFTFDRSTFDRFLDRASTDAIPDPATNLEAAAGVASTVLVRDGGRGAHVVVLLSDGEDVEGKLEGAIRTLAGQGIATFAVGTGTATGAPIPEPEGGWHRDWTGQVVITRLVEANLRDLARRTGGWYVRWSGEASMGPIVDRIARLPRGEAEDRARTPLPDRFQWPLALALAALLAETRRGERPRRRDTRRSGALRGAAALLVLGLVAATTGLQRASDPVSLYRSGHFREAYEAFRALMRTREARRDAERSAVLAYNSGNALYRMSRYEEAVSSYHAALAGAPELRERAYFNLGDTYMRLADGASDKRGPLRGAIDAYEEALALDPDDRAAKWNLELALRRLAAEQDRLGGGPHRTPNWGGGNVTKAGYAGRPETGSGTTPGGGYASGERGEAAKEITESQARQMLSAIENAQVVGQGSGRMSGAHPTDRRKDW